MIFETRQDIINSQMIHGKEMLINKLGEDEANAIKSSFGKNSFDKSQSFDSNLIECVAFSATVQKELTLGYANQDIVYLVNVMIAVLIYMIFHTQSLFLALASLLNIFMSLPISLCIYKYIF